MSVTNLTLGKRTLRLLATVALFASLLSLAAWVIKTDNSFSTQVIRNKLIQFQDEFDGDIASKHKKRTKHMQEYCAKHANNPSESHLVYLSNFIVSEKYKIVFCPVPKVSCSVWKKLLAKLEGVNIVKNVHEEIKYKLKSLKKYSLKARENILNTYTKFMFVREPFERLLSAYRDVFLGRYKRNDAFWTRYRRRVRDYLVKHGRFDIDLNADNTTFEEFVSYVILTWKNGEKLQVHWRKMIDICHPCYIQFDFIGHYENLVEDATFILRKAKLSDKVQFPGWRPTATNTLIQNYYSNLTLKQIIQLKKIYNDDIEQFDYTFPGLYNQ